MCGIAGVAVSLGNRPRAEMRHLRAMRDALRHRGPDGAGEFDGGHILLAHRRLAVIDPTPAGAQPMSTPDGRFTIVYNGELYNDAALRASLAARGVVFRSSSDTETMLHALALDGPGALRNVRGMYALAFLDATRNTLLLARDPLGIKPLFVWKSALPGGGCELAFASQPAAFAHHPAFVARPDWAVVSAFLTTIRSTLGERTLLQGVRLVQPGAALRVNLADPALPEESIDARPAPASTIRGEEEALEVTRAVVSESVAAHLRSDVPLCCLLSGGLDSTIITTLAAAKLGAPGLRTYCAGAASGPGANPHPDDLAVSRSVSELLGTQHAQAVVSRELFLERWAEMVDRQKWPLSTPNEVAIHEVAARLRADGCIVTLSGEGADELFGGYDLILGDAADFEQRSAAAGILPGTPQHAPNLGRFFIENAAWTPPAAKSDLLTADALRDSEHDAPLFDQYRRTCAQATAAFPNSTTHAHLNILQSVNLAGLLLRLDSASMLAGVEGRTPLADVRIASLCAALPAHLLFAGRGVESTKVALRRAFADSLPDAVVRRPKASFPLPFQSWIADVDVGRSEFLSRLLTPEALRAVSMRPGETWRLAWPALNLAMFARTWWGG